jgi:hypothetical protein
MIGRIFGWIFILAAAAAAAAQLIMWYFLEKDGTVTIGSLWFALHSPSLNLSQAVVQRYIAVWLWDPVIIAVLTAPAWLVLGLAGVVILLLKRLRLRRRRRRTIFTDGP